MGKCLVERGQQGKNWKKVRLSAHSQVRESAKGDPKGGEVWASLAYEALYHFKLGQPQEEPSILLKGWEGHESAGPTFSGPRGDRFGSAPPQSRTPILSPWSPPVRPVLFGQTLGGGSGRGGVLEFRPSNFTSKKPTGAFSARTGSYKVEVPPRNIWVPPRYEPQILVHACIYQRNPFWGSPI